MCGRCVGDVWAMCGRWRLGDFSCSNVQKYKGFYSNRIRSVGHAPLMARLAPSLSPSPPSHAPRNPRPPDLQHPHPFLIAHPRLAAIPRAPLFNVAFVSGPPKRSVTIVTRSTLKRGARGFAHFHALAVQDLIIRTAELRVLW